MSQTTSPCENCQRECPEKGCTDWRKWFIDWWNALVYIGQKNKPREVFQYEHPDRYTACSDHCTKPEFQGWQAEQETIRKNKAAYNSMNNYVFRQSERNRRARK